MKAIKSISVLFAVFSLSGCSLTNWYPEHFDTVSEVYPNAADSSQLAAAPPSSKTATTFNAPYFDVFAVASRSVTQNQWNLVSQDENTGTILATKVVAGQFNTPNGPVPAERHYHFLIGVEEASAGQTQLWAVAKTQGACMQLKRGTAGAMTFGMSEASFPESMKNCRDQGSKTNWAIGINSAKAELDNLAILIRNNLIALGYE